MLLEKYYNNIYKANHVNDNLATSNKDIVIVAWHGILLSNNMLKWLTTSALH
jgi:hypothetical protein